MNKPVIDFYFDFISPYSYLAATRLDAFSHQYGAHFEWMPVNLPKLIHWAGNTPPSAIKKKALYSLRDLKRWAKFLDVPFTIIRPGSFDSRPAMRTALALALPFTHKSRHSESPGGYMQGRALKAMVVPLQESATQQIAAGRLARREPLHTGHACVAALANACQWNNHYLRTAPWPDPCARVL